MEKDILNPFSLSGPKGQAGPLVFSSPHSGRVYPARFRALSQLDEHTLRLSEDCYVDELFAGAPAHGAPLIAGRYPRAYIDVNREPYELDPAMFRDALPTYVNARSERVAVGLGTIARIVSLGIEIYGGKLDFAEEAARITDVYMPYHRALTELLEKARNEFGWAVLVDCHSMPSVQSGAAPGLYRPPSRHLGGTGGPVDPDIVIGDRYGTSCAPALTAYIENAFLEMGYRVARNDPYAGGYCTIRYGDPHRRLHAVQIEINRRLYMCERTLKRDAEGFARVRRDIDTLIAGLSRLNLGREQPLAAE